MFENQLIVQLYIPVCVKDTEHAGAEDASGGAADGEWVPAPPKGHEPQWKDEGDFWQVDPANRISAKHTAGLLATNLPAVFQA